MKNMLTDAISEELSPEKHGAECFNNDKCNAELPSSSMLLI